MKVEGFPKGVTTDIDNAAKKITISGTPTEAGSFGFKVSATSSDSTFAKSGKIVVTDPNVPASSSSEDVVPGSSSSETSAIRFNVARSTEAETGFYRIFDMQGRPLFAGEHKPAKMPAARVVVVEFTRSGTMLRRYVQAR